MRSPRTLLFGLLALLALGAWGVVRWTAGGGDADAAGLDVSSAEDAGSPVSGAGGLRATDAGASERAAGAVADASSSSRRPGAGAWVLGEGPPDLRAGRVEVPRYFDGALTCLVVDPAGEPVQGARLVRVTSWHDTSVAAVREARTDERGRAVFVADDDQRWQEQHAAHLGEGPSFGLDATLADDGLRDLKDVSEADLPARFVLPPYGELTITLQGPGETRWGAHTLLQLVPAGLETGLRGSPRHRWVRAERGRATFPQVQAGMGLELLVDTFGERTVHPLRALAPGEAREETLHLGAEHVTGRLQLVDPEGLPLADTRVLVSRSAGQHWLASDPTRQSYVSDEHGHLTVVLEPADPGQGSRTHHVSVTSAVAYGSATTGVRILQGRFELPAVPAGTVVDLGRVFLEPDVERLEAEPEEVPLLVRGVVVDASGGPVAGARVRVATRHGALVRDPGDLTRELEQESGAAGRFELHARVQGSHELRVEHPEHGGAEVPFTPGQELRVVLTPAGHLAGTLVLPSTFPLDVAELRLRAARGSAAIERRERRASPAPDGTFRFDGLAPGTYDLELRCRDWNVPLRTLSGLEVPAGGPCPDARLAGVAPDAAIRTVDLVVTSETGRPVRGGRLVVRPRGYAHAIPPVSFSGDRHTLVVPEGELECEVEVTGHRRKVVPLEGAFHSIRLEELREGEAGEGPLGPFPAGGGFGQIGGR